MTGSPGGPGAAGRPAQQGVLVVGCGLIGRRRARSATAHAGSRLCAVVDPDPAASAGLASGTCDVVADWQSALLRPDIDVVVVATPNAWLADVAVAALEAGKHVLMEKPMGRGLEEALRIARAAEGSSGVLRIGFNHRHHPGIRQAAERVRSGALGPLITLRARYGHGGRPGLEREWRSDPVQAGGGELLDQGVHLADLFHWLAGMPDEVFAMTQTAVWPIAPLEDNAYALMRFGGGAVGQWHVSMSQWKNLFSLEVHGEAGAVIVEGLGGSYGTERLAVVVRAFEGGRPAIEERSFDGEDASWDLEWEAFLRDIATGSMTESHAGDGVAAMRIIEALYRSARDGVVVRP
ncbi:MAG TPA: Gfo/Idh/MocA family oxidoreductase [Longimicrobiales bacterium]|nr:Gfo/Idh/MocA family oxidoreductase [Longimicrobiales bacterium]